MDHLGIDVHKKESQICILAEGGELIEQRIRTEPERFAAVLGERPPDQLPVRVDLAVLPPRRVTQVHCPAYAAYATAKSTNLVATTRGVPAGRTPEQAHAKRRDPKTLVAPLELRKLG